MSIPDENILHPSLWGHVVAQLVEALRYRPAVRGFNSLWC